MGRWVGRADVEILLRDLQMTIVEGKKLGLIVSTAKCEVIADDENVVERFRLIAPDIKHVRKSAVMLRGAPIGDKQSVDAVLAAKLEDLQRFSGRLKLLAHDALFLLKNCFTIPKLTYMYMLRSAPCYTRRLPVLLEYDNVLRETLTVSSQNFHVGCYVGPSDCLLPTVALASERQPKWHFQLFVVSSWVAVTNP